MTPTPEQTLAALRHSLELPLPPSPSPPDATPVKAVDVAQALLALPGLVQSVQSLVVEVRQSQDLYTRVLQIDDQLQGIARRSQSTSQRLSRIAGDVAQRLEYLTVTEQKFLELMRRVHALLDIIENELRAVAQL